MINLVDCPACQGRGTYCLRANDGSWSELLIAEVPCDFCNGKRKVTYVEAIEYHELDLWETAPYFPYAEVSRDRHIFGAEED